MDKKEAYFEFKREFNHRVEILNTTLAALRGSIKDSRLLRNKSEESFQTFNDILYEKQKELVKKVRKSEQKLNHEVKTTFIAILDESGFLLEQHKSIISDWSQFSAFSLREFGIIYYIFQHICKIR